jgi:hypothetical protein
MWSDNQLKFEWDDDVLMLSSPVEQPGSGSREGNRPPNANLLPDWRIRISLVTRFQNNVE